MFAAGSKQVSLQLAPGQGVTLSWQLLAYNAGAIRLPAVTIHSARHSASLNATYERHVFVRPMPVTGAPTPQMPQPSLESMALSPAPQPSLI